MRKQHHQQSVTQQHHTSPKVQLDMDFHILHKYTREGPYWKRVIIEPHTAFYQTHDGPNIKRLTPWRQTKLQIVGGERNIRLVEDERTRQSAKTSDKPWTGWTNFEEYQEFPTQLESDDEEQQQGTKAKAAQAPKQPTPQEIREHNVTHLLTGIGVQYAYKLEADKKTITQSNTATFQSYSLTSNLG